MELAAELGLPRLVFVNKLDRERASFDRTLAALRERFGAGIAPLELPVGEEAGLPRHRRSAHRHRHHLRGREARPPGPSPTTWPTIEHEVREQLVEGIVVGDDDAHGALPRRRRSPPPRSSRPPWPPVWPRDWSSRWCAGRRSPAWASIVWPRCWPRSAPPPDARPPVEVRAGDGPARWRATPAANRWPGCSRPSPTPTSARSRCCGSCPGRSAPTPSSPTRAPTATNGSTCCSCCGARRRSRRTRPGGRHRGRPQAGRRGHGDTLAPKGTPVLVPSPPSGARGAVRGHPTEVEGRRGQAHDRPAPAAGGGPDPRRRASRRDAPDHPAGTGETHLAVSVERLARKFGVEVETEDVLVPYRETITAEAEAEGKYKKQTGGHGQFGVASIRIEPLGRGRGLPVHRPGGRGRHPQAVHPGGGEGDRRGHGRTAASTATRWSTCR